MKENRLLVLGIMLCLILSNVAAQEAENVTVENENKVSNFMHNTCKDGWFLSIGAGPTWNADGMTYQKSHPNISGVANIDFGKWITPSFGARLGLVGGGMKVMGTQVESGDFNPVKSNFYLHGDVLWNWSNSFCGYKPDRLYNFIAYASFGGVMSSAEENGYKYTHEIAWGLGALQTFNVHKNVNLFIDLRGTMFRAKHVGTLNDWASTLDLMLGVQVKFNETGWKRADCSKAIAAVQSELDALQANNRKLAEENARLTSEVNKCNDGLSQCEADKQACSDKVSELEAWEREYNKFKRVFNFGLGKTVLSGDELAKLNAYKAILAEGKDYHFVVAGVADMQTGSAEVNTRIANERAEYVKRVLVDAGIPAEHILTKIEFVRAATPEEGRLAVVTIEK